MIYNFNHSFQSLNFLIYQKINAPANFFLVKIYIIFPYINYSLKLKIIIKRIKNSKLLTIIINATHYIQKGSLSNLNNSTGQLTNYASLT